MPAHILFVCFVVRPISMLHKLLQVASRIRRELIYHTGPNRISCSCLERARCCSLSRSWVFLRDCVSVGVASFLAKYTVAQRTLLTRRVVVTTVSSKNRALCEPGARMAQARSPTMPFRSPCAYPVTHSYASMKLCLGGERIKFASLS